MLLLSYAGFFKLNFRNTIRLSTVLDPDRAQRSVGPDLGQNCLQRISAEDNVIASKEIVN